MGESRESRAACCVVPGEDARPPQARSWLTACEAAGARSVYPVEVTSGPLLQQELTGSLTSLITPWKKHLVPPSSGRTLTGGERVLLRGPLNRSRQTWAARRSCVESVTFLHTHPGKHRCCHRPAKPQTVGTQWTNSAAAAAGGDSSAFAHLYDATAAEVHGYLISVLIEHPEDRLREAYLQYWAQLPRLPDHSEVYAVVWLALAACRSVGERPTDFDRPYAS